MTEQQNWENLYQLEIAHAEEARLAGNEGMARVCARRAAGIVLGEYFLREGIDFNTPSAYARLQFMKEIPGIPEDIRTVIGHFLLRIKADHTLPEEADLIEDAKRMKTTLLSR